MLISDWSSVVCSSALALCLAAGTRADQQLDRLCRQPARRPVNGQQWGDRSDASPGRGPSSGCRHAGGTLSALAGHGRVFLQLQLPEIGRAPGRERGCQYGKTSGEEDSLKKKLK